MYHIATRGINYSNPLFTCGGPLYGLLLLLLYIVADAIAIINVAHVYCLWPVAYCLFKGLSHIACGLIPK